MCIHYLLHGSSIVKLALSLSSHSPILMNMMFHQLIPWLRRLKHSGQSVPKFCEANQGFGQTRLLPDDGEAIRVLLSCRPGPRALELEEIFSVSLKDKEYWRPAHRAACICTCFGVNGIGLICRLSHFMRTLIAFSSLLLLLDGRIHCRGPKVLQVLKDAFRDLYKELNLQLMRTSTPATKAFGSAFWRLLQTGTSGAQSRRGRASRARTWGPLCRLLGRRRLSLRGHLSSLLHLPPPMQCRA